MMVVVGYQDEKLEKFRMFAGTRGRELPMPNTCKQFAFPSTSRSSLFALSMTLNISRTYFGGVLNRQGIASSSRVTACLTLTLSLPSCRYATASAALTKKGPVTAKGTRKDAHNKPATPKKPAPKKLPKQSSSPAMETAHSVSEPIPSPEHAVKKDVQGDPKRQEELTEEEKIEEMQRMMAFAHLMPTIDPWGQEITETLGELYILSSGD